MPSSLQHLCDDLEKRRGPLSRRAFLFHDLITQTLLISLQYGIVVMGVIDAFVYAPSRRSRHHTPMRTKPSASWGAHMPVTAKDSASFGPRASTRTFQTSEPPRGKETKTLRCGRFSTDGKTHVSDGETTARWGVVARSPMKVMNRVWSGRTLC